MKKLFLLSVVFIALAFCAAAQPGELIIKGGSKGLYLDHKVAPKEGLFAIGRLYNTHPKHIAAYNRLDMNAGLAIDQVIHIPLTDTNFTQKTKNGTPVYYAVGEGEGLLKVSNANNKVTMQKLRDWNGLTNDNIPAGAKLVVGFLVSKEMAALAINNPVKEQPVKQQEVPVVKQQPIEEKPVVKAEPVKEIKEEPKKEEIVREVKPIVKEEPKKEEPVFAKQENNNQRVSEQGYFKTAFDQQVRKSPASKNTTVTSGIFKTTSGWQDAKYYLLIDNVATGTIVKIINPDNNKAIYAKVLGEMNGIRQNQGLNIRISNAASAALGVADTEKFILKLNY